MTRSVTAADVRPGTVASRQADGSIAIVSAKSAKVSTTTAVPLTRTAPIFNSAELKRWAAGAAALRQRESLSTPEKREPERDTLALIQSVGLKGFAAASPPKATQPQPQGDDGDDVIALALSVGLLGYVKANEAEYAASLASEGDR